MSNTAFVPQVAAALFGVALASAASALPIEGPGDSSGFIVNPRPATVASPLNAKLAEGYQALKRGDLSGAESAFTEASRVDARDPGPLLGLAEVARLRKKMAESEKWLRRALDIAPGSADANRAWGRYQFGLRDYSAAEVALKKAAALDPNAVATQFDLGDLYLNWLHRPADAVAAYRQAVKLQPDQSNAHFELGMALVAQSETDAAVSEFERSAALAPGNPAPWTAVARLYASTGASDKALAAYDHALRIKADYVAAIAGRGDLYMMRNEPSSAATDYEKAIQLEPRNPWYRFKAGAAYQSLGRPGGAEISYRSAIAADDKFAPAYNNLAALLVASKGNLDEALGFAKRAVTLSPDVADFEDTLGSVHLARGEVDLAIQAMRKATSIAPKRADFHYALGNALAQKGNPGEAVDAFRTALSVDPGFDHAAAARKRIEELSRK